MKKLVVMLALVSLIACNKNDDKSSGSSSTDFSHPLVQKADLTTSQMEEIKGIVKGSTVMPDSRVLVGGFNEDATDKAKREEKIKKLSPESKQIFDKIQADCTVGKPTQVVTPNSEKKGEKQTTKENASIDGEKCPIDYKEENTYDVTTTRNAKTGAGQNDQIQRTTGQRISTVKILTEDLQKQVGYKSNVTKGNQVSTFEITSGNSNFNLEATGSLALITVKDEMVKLETRMISRMSMKGSASAEAQTKAGAVEVKSEAYTQMDFEFPSSKPTVQMYKNADEKEPRFYLNGKKTTVEKLNESLGMKFEFTAGSVSGEKSATDKQAIIETKEKFLKVSF